jgi:hypothetical protein
VEGRSLPLGGEYTRRKKLIPSLSFTHDTGIKDCPRGFLEWFYSGWNVYRGRKCYLCCHLEATKEINVIKVINQA